ncbi:MAG: hypothetical protein HYU64_00445 [Armatimonadetes bacterium]|nr:hypothetical protein [Armatimonadota bacterium]
MGPYELLEITVKVFEHLRIPYLVTGSVAAMAYGEPRLTNDIDIVAGIDEGHIPDLLAAFPEDEFYVSAEMIQEAIREYGQFNILHPSSGLKVDVIIRRDTPFDRSRFERRRRIHPSETYQADFAAPEDVIVKKMEYYREGGSEKHLRDITGILKIGGNEVDLDYVSEWAKKLGLEEIWNAVKERLRTSSTH